MQFAIEEAQRSLADFQIAMVFPVAHRTGYQLKVRFTGDDGSSQQIWVNQVVQRGNRFDASLADEPRLPGFHLGQRVNFPYQLVTDWMYVESGYLVGGFTTQAARFALSPAERERFDASLPFKVR